MFQRAINWGKLRELLGDNIADGEPEVYDFNDIPRTTCCKFSLERHYQTEMKEFCGFYFVLSPKILIFATKYYYYISNKLNDYAKNVSMGLGRSPDLRRNGVYIVHKGRGAE